MPEYLQPFRLFSAGLIQDLFAKREAEAIADADTLSDKELLADTAHNVGQTVIERHQIVPPQIEEEFRDGPPRSVGEAGSLRREFTLKMRLSGEPQLLRLTPLHRTPTEIEARLNNDELWITINDAKQSLQAQVETIRSTVDDYLVTARKQCEQFNTVLRNKTLERVAIRHNQAMENRQHDDEIGIRDRTINSAALKVANAEFKRVTSMEPDRRKIFVIHGRDERIRRAMFSFLRAIDLDPMEFDLLANEAGSGAPYVGEVLDIAFKKAWAVLALFSPDDIAYLREDLRGDDEHEWEKNPTGQARPNVLFETGMALGRFPKRTVLVEFGKVRPYSDVGGRLAIRFDASADSRVKLADRLSAIECAVNRDGKRDWLHAGDFPVLTSTSSRRKTVGLGGRARELLEAAVAADGTVQRVPWDGGSSFATAKGEVGDADDPQVAAEYEAGFDELLVQGLIKQLSDGVFKVTDRARRLVKDN